MPDQPTTVGPDWCWHHYAAAPAGALLSDLGPAELDDVDEWTVWLEASVDAPIERRRAHAEQLHLVDRLREFGEWTAEERERYRATAASDPTPATVCETVGARIIPAPDGSLPEGWDERFTDPHDPAFSRAALTEIGAAR